MVEKINPPILHYPYENEAQLEAKAERYAQLYAKQNHRKKNISLWSVPLRSAFTFFKDYVLRRGWLYDSDGFTIARYNALGTKLKYRYLHQENKDWAFASSYLPTTEQTPLTVFYKVYCNKHDRLIKSS